MGGRPIAWTAHGGALARCARWMSHAPRRRDGRLGGRQLFVVGRAGNRAQAMRLDPPDRVIPPRARRCSGRSARSGTWAADWDAAYARRIASARTRDGEGFATKAAFGHRMKHASLCTWPL
jgi:hypothetical protein